MAGRKLTKEKEKQMRQDLHNKGMLTREEMQGQLLKGIRAEQLDTTTEDALTAKNRIHRLSCLGATKALDIGLVKEENVVAQRPPRWERLLSAEFTTKDWNLVVKILPKDVVKAELPSPSELLRRNKEDVRRRFWAKTYEDEDVMKLINEAYQLGVEDANKNIEAGGTTSFVTQAMDVIEAQRRIIDFLIMDHEERIDPILTLTPRELVERVTLYFVECDLVKRFYTVPGLSFYVGFATRDDFFKYIEANPESVHAYILKRAVTFIEAERVTDMLYGGGMMAGHKLDLATNFNYNDAGKKSDSGTQAPTININNNLVSLDSLPPKAKDLNEWYSWYAAEQERKALDVTPQDAVGCTPPQALDK